MIRFLFFISLILSATFAQSQKPCVNGKAGKFPCNNYDLMGFVPISTLANSNGNPSGSDIWGWTDSKTKREYAIMGMSNSTAFVDITDPVNPVFLGRLDSNSQNSNH